MLYTKRDLVWRKFDGSSRFVVPRSGGLPPILRQGLDRLDPYAGNLWGISYFGNMDYDLMLTNWGRHAHRAFVQIRGNEPLTKRYLGAWNVKFTVAPRSLKEQVQDRDGGEKNPAAGRVTENPYFLPRYRFAPQVVFHSNRAAALAAAQSSGFTLNSQDHWIDSTLAEGSGRVSHSSFDTRLADLKQSFSTISAHYSASEPTYFVAAVTFDKGWRATADEIELKTFPTAIGQIGIELPPGRHHLKLWYADSTVGWGGLLSLLSLSAASFWFLRTRIVPTQNSQA